MSDAALVSALQSHSDSCLSGVDCKGRIGKYWKFRVMHELERCMTDELDRSRAYRNHNINHRVPEAIEIKKC